jgi:hypothetical protein
MPVNYTDALLVKQLDELDMIRCSLLPGEVLTFLDDSEAWADILDAHATGADLNASLSILAPPHLQIKLESVTTWFEVQIPPQYSGDLKTCRPAFSVKGENISRHEQERWRSIVKEKIDEIEDTEFASLLVADTTLIIASIDIRSISFCRYISSLFSKQNSMPARSLLQVHILCQPTCLHLGPIMLC